MEFNDDALPNGLYARLFQQEEICMCWYPTLSNIKWDTHLHGDCLIHITFGTDQRTNGLFYIGRPSGVIIDQEQDDEGECCASSATQEEFDPDRSPALLIRTRTREDSSAIQWKHQLPINLYRYITLKAMLAGGSCSRPAKQRRRRMSREEGLD